MAEDATVDPYSSAAAPPDGGLFICRPTQSRKKDIGSVQRRIKHPAGQFGDFFASQVTHLNAGRGTYRAERFPPGQAFLVLTIKFNERPTTKRETGLVEREEQAVLQNLHARVCPAPFSNPLKECLAGSRIRPIELQNPKSPACMHGGQHIPIRLQRPHIRAVAVCAQFCKYAPRIVSADQRIEGSPAFETLRQHEFLGVTNLFGVRRRCWLSTASFEHSLRPFDSEIRLRGPQFFTPKSKTGG